MSKIEKRAKYSGYRGLGALISLSMLGCSGGADAGSAPSPGGLESSGEGTRAAPERTEKEWTLAVYLAAETLSDMLPRVDINALERQYAELAPFMDIVILADGFYEAPERNWLAKTRVLHIRSDDTDNIASDIPVPADTELARMLEQHGEELELHSPAVLKAFLDYVLEHYPSKHLSVNIHDHGDAWRGAVYDFIEEEVEVKKLGPMRLAEFRSVFSSIGRSIDVLGFDACLMQELSTNTYWSTSTPSVRYVVASEQNQNLPGWHWDNIARRFVDRRRQDGVLSPAAFATEIVQAFDEESFSELNTTLSALDLADWSQVVRSLEELGAALVAAGAMQNPTVKAIVDERVLRRYGALLTGDKFDRDDLVDVAGFCRLFEESFAAESSVARAAFALRTAVERSTVMSKTRDEISTGLALYVPKPGIAADLQLAEFEKHGGLVLSLAPSWHAFLRSI